MINRGSLPRLKTGHWILPDGETHVVIEQIEIIGSAPKRRPFEEALGRVDEPEEE